MRESGTYAGIRFLYWAHRIFGRGFFRLILVFVSIYFLIARGEQRKASRLYLSRHYQKFPEHWNHEPNWLDSVRHFHAFGEAVLDKVLAWSQPVRESAFDIIDRSAIDQILQDPRGQLIIGSHLGNLEYCRGFMHSNKNKVINILVYDRHSANFARAMTALNPQSRLNVYQVDQMDVTMILSLKKRVDRGEWIFIAADRIPEGGDLRSVEVSFLNQAARLPVGPYHLAMTLQCPVQLLFAYRKKQRITVDLIPFEDRLELPKADRQERLTQYAQRFAAALESHCQSVPFQWFNFYDFWAPLVLSHHHPKVSKDSA